MQGCTRDRGKRDGFLDAGETDLADVSKHRGPPLGCHPIDLEQLAARGTDIDQRPTGSRGQPLGSADEPGPSPST